MEFVDQVHKAVVHIQPGAVRDAAGDDALFVLLEDENQKREDML